MVKQVLILMLLSNSALASGELALVPSYSLNNEKIGHKFSLNIYENIGKGFYINPYAQYEHVFDSHNQFYGKLDLNKHLTDKLIIGGGVSHLLWENNKNSTYQNSDVHVNVIIKLW